MFLAMNPWILIASEPITAWPSLWISMAGYFATRHGSFEIIIEDKHAAALEKTISKASDASNSGKDFSFGSDDVPPEVKDMSTGHAISA